MAGLENTAVPSAVRQACSIPGEQHLQTLQKSIQSLWHTVGLPMANALLPSHSLLKSLPAPEPGKISFLSPFYVSLGFRALCPFLVLSYHYY